MLPACVISLVLLADQLIKYTVKTNLCLRESVEITPWFQIFFTENEGMAFGMDFIGTAFLTIFRLLAVSVFLRLLAKAVRRGLPAGLLACISLIVAGAAGNIIDNSFYGLVFSESTPFQTATLVPFGEGYGSFLAGRVVDMFYFPLFSWPDWMPLVGGDTFFGAVFNFADACISCGAVALLLFYPRYLHASGGGVADATSEEPTENTPA